MFEDENQVQTSVAYESAAGTLDRPVAVARGSNHPEARQKTAFFYYDDPGEIRVETRTDQNVFGDGRLRSEARLDGLGREWKRIQYEDAGQIETETRYDGLGRVRQVCNPRRPADPYDWTSTKYDALGRVVEVKTESDAAVVTTDYNLYETTVRDQAEKTRKSVTDALGRIVQVYEDPAPGQMNYQTSYLYSVLDNLAQVSQGTQTRTFAYDSLSRLICAANPESRDPGKSCLASPLPTSGLDRFMYL